MISRLLPALAFLLLGLHLPSQQSTSVQHQSLSQQPVLQAGDGKQPAELNSDVSMQDWIVKQDTRVARMANLGIEKAFAENWNWDAVRGFPLYPRFKSFRIGANRRAAILFFACTPSTESARLYLLMLDKFSWQVTDHLELDCHYDDHVSFEIAAIHDSQKDEILIHHSCVGRGTGYLVQVFSIYSVIGQKFKQEMQTDELRNESPPPGLGPELERHSSFTIIPVAGSSSRIIEETRTEWVNGRFSAQRRQFRWNPADARYEATPLTAVLAAIH
ncbi:MAG: hypothetical protein ABSA42_17640 [Terracidiphilus sp.]|jgi:hypothetical protein